MKHKIKKAIDDQEQRSVFYTKEAIQDIAITFPIKSFCLLNFQVLISLKKTLKVKSKEI